MDTFDQRENGHESVLRETSVVAYRAPQDLQEDIHDGIGNHRRVLAVQLNASTLR